MARRSRNDGLGEQTRLLAGDGQTRNYNAIEKGARDDDIDGQHVQPYQPGTTAEPQKNPRRALFVLSYVLIVVRIQFTSLQPISN
jgi:hypothetical protein